MIIKGRMFRIFKIGTIEWSSEVRRGFCKVYCYKYIF